MLGSPHPTLLIVDDDAACRVLLTTLLSHYGYDCVEAENGVAALALLRRNTIDLIILDYEMPSMNGCEFLEELERTVAHPPPAVMVTGNLRAPVWKRAMDAGAKAILSKPYESTTMLSVLEDHVRLGVV
jgi:CheY-like chemotaxis protein